MAKLYAETFIAFHQALGLSGQDNSAAKIHGLDPPTELLVQCAWAAHRANVMPEQ